MPAPYLCCYHRRPLGGNDWNWNHDAGTMAYGWKAAIAAQRDYEMVWSVGLRGLNDGAYSCSTPADCGAQISAAMSNQTAWIHEMAGPNATLVSTRHAQAPHPVWHYSPGRDSAGYWHQA